ncbi:MAG: hypothetical protein ABW063_04040 [Caulobacter sp.]
MSNKSTRERLLASSMICGAAFFAMSAGAAFAHEENPVEGIVVTGSRIARPDLVSSTPIATVGEQELKQSGIVNTENLLNTLPQAVPGRSSRVVIAFPGKTDVDSVKFKPNYFAYEFIYEAPDMDMSIWRLDHPADIAF